MIRKDWNFCDPILPAITTWDKIWKFLSSFFFTFRKYFPLNIPLNHSVHQGINLPSKTPPLSFLPSPPLNLKTVQASSFLGNLHSMLVFHEPPPPLPPPPLKVRCFSEPAKFYNFLSLTPSYVTATGLEPTTT